MLKKIKTSARNVFGTAIEWILGFGGFIKFIATTLISPYLLELLTLGVITFLLAVIVMSGLSSQGAREKTDNPNITVRTFTYNGHRYFSYDRGVCHDEGGCPCRNQRKTNEVSR